MAADSASASELPPENLPATGLGPLRVRDVVRTALSIYKRRFGLVAGLAAIIFGLGAIAEAIVDRAADYPSRSALIVVILVGGTSVATLGSTLYAGLLDEVVGGDLSGEPPPSLMSVIHDLPWLRLIIADVVLTVVAVLFAAGFVILGIVVYTFACLVGPVINIEKRGVFDGFRRSAQLVRPHFWLVALLVTAAVVGEHALIHAMQELLPDHSLPKLFVANAIFGIAVGSIVGLNEVVIAYALIIRDHVRQTNAPASPPA